MGIVSELGSPGMNQVESCQYQYINSVPDVRYSHKHNWILMVTLELLNVLYS